MNEEIVEYEKYLLSFGMVKKTQMPKFNVCAYTESEYVLEIFQLLNEFDEFDDEYLTIKHLKGI